MQNSKGQGANRRRPQLSKTLFISADGLLIDSTTEDRNKIYSLQPAGLSITYIRYLLTKVIDETNGFIKRVAYDATLSSIVKSNIPVLKRVLTGVSPDTIECALRIIKMAMQTNDNISRILSMSR